MRISHVIKTDQWRSAPQIRPAPHFVVSRIKLINTIRSDVSPQGTLPRFEAASRQIITALVLSLALVLDFIVLVLASVLSIGVLVKHQVAISARHTVKVCKINHNI